MEITLNPLVLVATGIFGISLLFNLIALGSMSWAVVHLQDAQQGFTVDVSAGLWRGCMNFRQTAGTFHVCVENSKNAQDWEKASGAMMCLAMIAVVCAVVMSVLPIFLKLRTKLLMAAATLAGSAAAVCSFISVCVYGVKVSDAARSFRELAPSVDMPINLGWSYALAVVHCVLALCGAVWSGIIFARTGEFE